MSPTKKTVTKVKDLARKAIDSRKAGQIKGGQKQLPYPVKGSPSA